MSSKKTFKEAIRDIKEGEIWCTENTEIYLNNKRDLIIKPKNYYKNGDVNMYTYIQVSDLEAEQIIETSKPLGLFWIKEGEWYTAIDNNTGDAWTECFKTKEECFKYLDGNDLCQCFSPD